MNAHAIKRIMKCTLLNCPVILIAGIIATGGPIMTLANDDLGGGAVRAPDFTGVTEWLNCEKPVRIADLKGQVVLLDFWTYCCINCMHIFPDLKYLEEKYRGQPLVVIGVHSGKFSQEKDAKNIRQAVLRHNLMHPVAVDNDYRVWRSYAVQAWPTLVLIDPEGRVVKQVAGEGHRAELDRDIAALLERHQRKGTLAAAPKHFRMERDSFAPTVLEFPGKVLADEQGRRLFISDTNHHRVLVADLDGRVQHIVGSGEIGLTDGSFQAARFHQPQGLALSAKGDTLFVADTENHAVRAIDLSARQVTTLAGTGKQSTDYNAAGLGRDTALSSPWDLARVGGTLYVAMAGTHQIWALDLKSLHVSVFAGTGREAGIDGPNRRAAFAQPSGLATDDRRLFVADSEISSIRAVELAAAGQTSLLAGSGELFEFGDTDGRGGAARFQHPLGVARHGTDLFVADTFNHRIRRIALSSGEVTHWAGTGRPEPGSPERIGFFEPGGLSVAGHTLYVADTNQHRIVAIDLASRLARILSIALPAKGPA